MTAAPVVTADRPSLLRRALRLEYLTVGWNIVEGLVAITAGLTAGSVALIGFGIDSFVEFGVGLSPDLAPARGAQRRRGR